MPDIVGDLARRLADRWLALVALPGVVFVVAAWFGPQVGWSPSVVRTTVDKAGQLAPGGVLLTIVAGTAAAMAVGMTVRASALLTRSLWLGQWPRPVADVGIGWRRRRWRRRVAKRVALQEKYPPETRDEAQQDAVDRAAAALTRLSPARPGRPTWQGDQAIAPMTVARERSGLDLEYAWPRLWLVLPDSTRTTLTAAETSYAAAVLGASWAWPYLALGFWWQPAFLVAAAVWTVGLVRARAAIRAVAVLVESVIDVHARSLAVALGTASTAGTGPLTVEEGAATTAAVRKGR